MKLDADFAVHLREAHRGVDDETDERHESGGDHEFGRLGHFLASGPQLMNPE